MTAGMAAQAISPNAMSRLAETLVNGTLGSHDRRYASSASRESWSRPVASLQGCVADLALVRAALPRRTLVSLFGVSLPDEWLWVVVPVAGPDFDGFDERVDRGEHAPAEPSFGQLFEPSFHHVEPGEVGVKWRCQRAKRTPSRLLTDREPAPPEECKGRCVGDVEQDDQSEERHQRPHRASGEVD